MPLLTRLSRLPAQLQRASPFAGTLPIERLSILPTAVTVARHFRSPLRILDYVFRGDGDLKYLDVPLFPPILFVCDPELIRLITVETANQGDFDRDTLPTQGISRVVGGSNLLFAQGEVWKKHRAAAAKVFGASHFQDTAVYHDMEMAIKRAVEPQIEELAARLQTAPGHTARMRLEPHIQGVMLNVLVNVLFGSAVPHRELQDHYLPAIASVIRYILLDTVANQLRLPTFRLPALTPAHARVKRDRRTFEELVDRVIATRSEGAGFWPLLTADGPAEAIRSNVRVFLAGALEATSSYVGWAIANLARHPAAQETAYREADGREISPAGRESATYLQMVLSETLRLNNALYFLPRVAVRDTTVTTSKGRLVVPAGTHIMLSTYHANRCEAHWGVARTGHPATAFVPERWAAGHLAACGRSPKETIHFGFGHGPRVCIGKHFSEVEAFVCLTLFLRRFRFRAVREACEADAGVSTRPKDGCEVELSLRF